MIAMVNISKINQKMESMTTTIASEKNIIKKQKGNPAQNNK